MPDKFAITQHCNRNYGHVKPLAIMATSRHPQLRPRQGTMHFELITLSHSYVPLIFTSGRHFQVHLELEYKDHNGFKLRSATAIVTTTSKGFRVTAITATSTRNSRTWHNDVNATVNHFQVHILEFQWGRICLNSQSRCQTSFQSVPASITTRKESSMHN